LAIPDFRQFPGGAPANVAVAIGKLGGEAKFVGQVGDDTFGRFLKQALDTYRVDTSLVSLHPEAKTALAFVFLDDSGERSFEFFRNNTADMLVSKDQISSEWFGDIFHFCSNTLTETDIAETTYEAIARAKTAGSLVSFDINLRHNLWPTGQADAAAVTRCFKHVDIIKVSIEELDYLAEDEQSFVKSAVAEGVKLVLITDGGEPIKVVAPGIYSSISTPKVDVVDTTAAGDAFTGGFLFALSREEDLSAALTDQDTLEYLTFFASQCGGFTVARQGAFTALPELKDVEDFLS